MAVLDAMNMVAFTWPKQRRQSDFTDLKIRLVLKKTLPSGLVQTFTIKTKTWTLRQNMSK
jgi:hypothetical protein